MWMQLKQLFTLTVLIGILEKGLALKCWKCSSALDATCRDHFNTTRIFLDAKFQQTYTYPGQIGAQTNPQLVDCQGMHTVTMTPLKNVCLKKVMSVPDSNGIYHPLVTRECRMISSHLKAGRCPEEMTAGENSQFLHYCSTCEYDGCNGASRMGLLHAGIIPTVLMVLLYY